MHTEALAAECSRRQTECNVAQAQLQAAVAQHDQLKSGVSQSTAAMANMQVDLLPQGLTTLSNVKVSGMCLLWSSISKDSSLTPPLCLQAQHASLQAALQDKEGSLQALQTRLQEAESKLEALKQSATKAMQAAEQRHAAVEERARLSEQVLTTPVTAGAKRHCHHLSCSAQKSTSDSVHCKSCIPQTFC